MNFPPLTEIRARILKELKPVQVTPALLEAAAGRPLPNEIDRPLCDAMNACFAEYEITTPLRAAHWLAQMAHETGGFKWFYELGGPTYFKKYDGRKDLGNTEPGDGYRFRGRGLTHLTGRANYARFGELLGLDLIEDPDLAARPDIAVKIACLYWRDRNINAKADKDDCLGVTRLINGGVNGHADRSERLRRLKSLLRLF